MDKSTVLEIISRFRAALESQDINIEKLVLYGSYAQDSFHEGSDIDIVVVSKNFSGKSYWERIDILSSAIYEVFAPIEAIAMTLQEWENKESMIVDYAKKGEVVT